MNQKMWDELKKQVSLKEMAADQTKRESERYAYGKVLDLMHNFEVDKKNGKFPD